VRLSNGFVGFGFIFNGMYTELNIND